MLDIKKTLWTENLFNFTDLAMKFLESRKFSSAGHGELICEILQDVQRKKIKNIVINIAPGHSKTFTTTAGLIPFILGHDPHCRAIYITSKADMAVKKTEQIKKVLNSSIYNEFLFPKTKLDKKGDSRMTIKNARGSVEGLGLHGNITGSNADLIILDDPVDAFASNHELNEGKGKIQTSILNRLRAEEGGSNYGFIIINQRTGENDMTKFFLDNYDIGYHLNLPFMETQNKTYIYNDITVIRGANIPLNPNFYTLDDVKNAIGDIDKSDTARRIFETQYQQNPKPAQGQIMKLSDFNYYSNIAVRNAKFEKMFITVDAASKSKEYNDYSVICCWGLTESGNCLLLDMKRDKLDFVGLSKMFKNFYEKWKNGFNNGGCGVTKILIEDASAGTQLIQSYEKLFPKYIIHPLTRSVDKFTRYTAVGRYIETGCVYLPSHDVDIDGVLNVKQSITDPFLNECIQFTYNKAHAHDDIVDNLIDAVGECYLKGKSWLQAVTTEF